MANDSPLVDEIETAISSGSSARRTQMLRAVTDLFIGGAASYSADEIELFDDVMGRLAAYIEVKARAELADKLAGAPRVPIRIVKALACDDIIDVAAPILTRSVALEECDIIENASTRSQDHLLAISRRVSLSEAVTDILVARGDQQVIRSVACNDGARFSEDGFWTLVTRSERDDVLAVVVGGRKDIPRAHLEQLVAKASDIVREKLVAGRPELSDVVRAVVSNIAENVKDGSVVVASTRDYTAAAEVVRERGRIQDRDVREFARASLFAETVVALASLCNVPKEAVEKALLAPEVDQALILARAANLAWQTAKAIIQMARTERGLPQDDLHDAGASFERLQVPTAQRIVRFYLVRMTADGPSHPLGGLTA